MKVQENTISKVVIEKNYYPIAGIYKYNAQKVNSVDGGKSFYYCGEGRFCKTLKEANAYKREVEKPTAKKKLK